MSESSLSRDEIEKKAVLEVENPGYVEDSVTGLNAMDKARIIQRANIIRRQREATNRISRGGKKSVGRKRCNRKGTKKASKGGKRKTQTKRKGSKKGRKSMRRRR